MQEANNTTACAVCSATLPLRNWYFVYLGKSESDAIRTCSSQHLLELIEYAPIERQFNWSKIVRMYPRLSENIRIIKKKRGALLCALLSAHSEPDQMLLKLPS